MPSTRRPKNRRVAKDRAWKAISAYIRLKDGLFATCVTCGSHGPWQDMQCGHFKHGLTYAEYDSGGFYVLEANLHPQCKYCNGKGGSGMLDEYTLFMIDTYGRELVEEFIQLRKIQISKPLKMYVDDFWEIEKEYKGKMECH